MNEIARPVRNALLKVITPLLISRSSFIRSITKMNANNILAKPKIALGSRSGYVFHIKYHRSHNNRNYYSA